MTVIDGVDRNGVRTRTVIGLSPVNTPALRLVVVIEVRLDKYSRSLLRN